MRKKKFINTLLTHWKYISLYIIALTIQLNHSILKSQTIELSSPSNFSVNNNIITASLKWNSDCDSFKLYLGTNPNADNILNGKLIKSKIFNTEKLELNTTYFWKIVAIHNSINIESPVWSFTTLNHLGEVSINIEYGAVKYGFGFFQSHLGNKVTAIDLNSYKKVFDYNFDGIYDVAPIIEQKKDGTPIIIEHETNLNRVKALYLSNGETAWISNNNLINYGGLGFNKYITPEGTILILVPAQDGLHALSVEDGSEIWYFPGSSPVYHSVPAVDQINGLIVYQDMQRVSIIDGLTGKLIRQNANLGDVTMHSNVLITNDNFGYSIATSWFDVNNRSNPGKVIVFDSSLNIKWKIDTILLENLSALSYNQGKLFIGQAAGNYPEQYLNRGSYNYKNVRAFDITNGNVIWTANLNQFNYSNILDIVYCNGSLLVMDDSPGFPANRILWRLNATNGEIMDTLDYKFPWSTCSSPVISNGILYEGGIPIRLGTGKKTDWNGQYCTQYNHFSAPDSAVISFTKLRCERNLITKIHDFNNIQIYNTQSDTAITEDLNTYFDKSFEGQEDFYYSLYGTQNYINSYILDNKILVKGKMNTFGSDTLILDVNSYGYILKNIIVIKVGAIPAQIKKFNTLELNEDFGTYRLNLKDYLNYNNSSIIKIKSNNGIINSSIMNDSLLINSIDNKFGADSIILSLLDSIYIFQDTIQIFVKPVNDSPYFILPVSPVLKTNSPHSAHLLRQRLHPGELKTLNLWSYFSDNETDSCDLKYTIISNNNGLDFSFDEQTGILKFKNNNKQFTETDLFITVEDDSLAKVTIKLKVCFEYESFKTLSYPNPVKTDLNIKYYIPSDGNISFKIYGLNGDLIQGKDINDLHDGMNDIKIPMSEFNDGIYFIKSYFISNDGTENMYDIKKVIKVGN